MFLTLFDLPQDMRDQFIEWKEAILDATAATSGQAATEAATQEGLQKALELFMYLTDLVKTRRGHPDEMKIHSERRIPRLHGRILLWARIRTAGSGLALT